MADMSVKEAVRLLTGMIIFSQIAGYGRKMSKLHIQATKVVLDRLKELEEQGMSDG